MKAILASKSSNVCANVLNGKASILIFKNFPKDYKGWIDLYCTKNKNYQLVIGSDGFGTKEYCNSKHYPPFIVSDILNGKVIARFYCENVEEIFTIGMYYHQTKTLDKNELPRLSCLSRKDLDNYLQGKNGYAIHISKLEIFDEPKALWEFEKYGSYKRKDIKCKDKDKGFCNRAMSLDGLRYVGCDKARLTTAPKNYCYVEETCS